MAKKINYGNHVNKFNSKKNIIQSEKEVEKWITVNGKHVPLYKKDSSTNDVEKIKKEIDEYNQSIMSKYFPKDERPSEYWRMLPELTKFTTGEVEKTDEYKTYEKMLKRLESLGYEHKEAIHQNLSKVKNDGLRITNTRVLRPNAYNRFVKQINKDNDEYKEYGHTIVLLNPEIWSNDYADAKGHQEHLVTATAYFKDYKSRKKK